MCKRKIVSERDTDPSIKKPSERERFGSGIG